MIIVWSKKAKETYDQNILFLLEEWNKSVAENFIIEVETALDLIAKRPHLFPVLDKHKGIFKIIIVRQITLYYRVKDREIQLLIFWNNYQNPKRLKL